MMDGIGFSTGAVARSDLQGALRLLQPYGCGAVELSALRSHELPALVRAIPHLDLAPYRQVSVHAPSAYHAADEARIAASLLPLARRGWLVVVHPDAIRDHRHWASLGDRLAIENMDRRKPGRTVQELRPVFARLPHASFCFDVAHAHQCDPSMDQAARLLDAFGDRLAEVHFSELDADGRHVRLSEAAIDAYQAVAEFIPVHVPVIIEAPVQPHEINAELEASMIALGRLVPCCA